MRDLISIAESTELASRTTVDKHWEKATKILLEKVKPITNKERGGRKRGKGQTIPDRDGDVKKSTYPMQLRPTLARPWVWSAMVNLENALIAKEVVFAP